MSETAGEVELKLRLPPESLRALLRHPALAPLKRAPNTRARLVAVYYDTPGRRLAREGVALRVRREGRAWVQALKGPPRDGSAAGLSSRDEFDWPLVAGARPPRPDLGLLMDTPYRTLIAKALKKGPLDAQFSTDVVRKTVPLSFPDSTLALLCVDQGEVRSDADGGEPRRIPLCEVELEIEAGDVQRLFELALTLAEDLPLRVEPRSKAQRGAELVTGAVPEPATATDVALEPGVSAAAAFASILRNCLTQIAANADGVAGDQADPEWIHQMRIGVRRARSALSLLRRSLAPGALGTLPDDLRWIASALGPARDLDVFITETLPTLRDAARHAPGETGMGATLDELESRAHARVRDARREAAEAAGSRRFTRLALELGSLCAGEARLSSLGLHSGLGRPAPLFAGEVLQRRHRRLRRLGDRLEELSPQDRHEVRIAAKKLRYATEFFASLFPDKRTRGYRKSLAELQGVLGILNDAAVAASLAATLSSPGAAANALFAGWAAAQGSAQERTLLRAWRRFAEQRPFWEAG